ncbi:MAG: alpha-D-ribose 1-methylphosphonate 5-triphosphate diphosphatase [Rhodobacteraceae bacterium]|nr:alpha-D-ribose 1-methylphosphonate 5-triphosphate diphosphatase [Paracoccaceae bacterium]
MPAIAIPVVLANARLILGDEVILGGVVIKDGIIAEIFSGANVPAGAIDCEGDFLSPGLVELHTDNLERHMSPRPGVDWPHSAAIMAHDAEFAGAGVTTVFDAMRVGSIITGKSNYKKYARQMVDEILTLRSLGSLRISHYFHLRAEICSETLIEEMAEFGPDDRIGIVSLMDHTPGQRQFADLTQMRTYLQGKYSMSDAAVEEHFTLLRRVKEKYGVANEAAAVSDAHLYGSVIASHDDTTEEHVVQSAKYGVGLAEFPTTIEAAKACHEQGISVMMGAPNLLRGGSHSGNVAAKDLAEAGLLDIMSSDYAPASLLMSAVLLGNLGGDMAAGIRTVTKAPAMAAGLEDRGEIAVGLRADITRFELVDAYPKTSGVWVQGLRVS